MMACSRGMSRQQQNNNQHTTHNYGHTPIQTIKPPLYRNLQFFTSMANVVYSVYTYKYFLCAGRVNHVHAGTYSREGMGKREKSFATWLPRGARARADETGTVEASKQSRRFSNFYTIFYETTYMGMRLQLHQKRLGRTLKHFIRMKKKTKHGRNTQNKQNIPILYRVPNTSTKQNQTHVARDTETDQLIVKMAE